MKQLPIHKYEASINTEHGQIIVKTMAISREVAIQQVIKMKQCKRSDIKRIVKQKTTY